MKTPDSANTVVDHPIEITELTPETFAPFGQLIEPTEDGVPFGPNDAQLVFGTGIPRFYIMRLPRKGLVATQITRHRQVTQCLASVAGKPWYIAVAPPGNVEDDNAEPTLSEIRAFRIPGTVAIKLNVGTWHAGPYFEDDAISFFNLELSETNIDDHQSCYLDRRYGVQLRFNV
jgi:ureidoglycolate lyase